MVDLDCSYCEDISHVIALLRLNQCPSKLLHGYITRIWLWVWPDPLCREGLARETTPDHVCDFSKNVCSSNEIQCVTRSWPASRMVL